MNEGLSSLPARRKFRQKLEAFLFTPLSPAPLAVLRIGVSITLLLQAWYLAPHLFELYGEEGLLQRGLGEEAEVPFLGLGFWLYVGRALGLAERAVLGGLGWIYVLALVATLVGWKTRAALVAAWFLHMCFNYGQTASYGLDHFAHVSLFFLIWMPAGAALSVDNLGKYVWGNPSPQARLSLRVLQGYLAITYLASGLEKIVGIQWRDGEAVWRSLNLPSLHQYDMGWVASYPWLPFLAGWGTLLVEIGYAVFIWPRKTRRLWMWLTVGMHAGIAAFLGLWLFSLIMIILNFAALSSGPWERGPKRQRASAPRQRLAGEGVALG